MRSDTQPGGQFNAPVEWAAYIVAEDYADVAGKRRIDRDAVAHGIGQTLLEILADPDLSQLGPCRYRPAGHRSGPGAGTPMFTAKSWEAGTAYYAVTWRQAFWNSGTPFFDASRVVDHRRAADSSAPGFRSGGDVSTSRAFRPKCWQ